MGPTLRSKTPRNRDTEGSHEMVEFTTLHSESPLREDAARPIGKREDSADATKSPSRPLTRSQTGRAPCKRLRYDDIPLGSKQKTTQISKTTVEPKTQTETLENMTPAERETSSDDPEPPLSVEVVFPSSADTNSVRPDIQSRAILPVPVPNLTKKSRGRRVPTRVTNESGNTDAANPRMYVCRVEGCGKCFHRGEHLKRHIRSIHTHEKPFECTFPYCDKHFNRHDNLLQHIKVHKALDTPESSNAGDDPDISIDRLQESSPLLLSVPHMEQDGSTQEMFEMTMKQARIAAMYSFPVSLYGNYSSTYTSLSEPVSMITNMAVSSLRTEIPHSPPSRSVSLERT